MAALAAIALVATGLATRAAETPFGINGTVPKLTADDVCSAEQRLERRGLRWRYLGFPELHAEAVEAEPGTSPSCEGEPIVLQRPKPGTHLGEGGIVVLESGCSRVVRRHEGGCS